MLYPILPRNSSGKDDTAYWEGFFSEEELDKILALPQWHEQQEAVVSHTLVNGVSDKNIRRSQVAWLQVTSETEWIWRKIANVVGGVNSTFFRFDLTGCYEAMQLSIYKDSDSGCYDWHIDASSYSKGVPRKLSMSLLLSDPSEFEGGELQVQLSKEAKVLEAKKGRAWFFPSYVLHRVTPVTKGVRRSLVLWVGGPEFK
jgi:PKHD-type hydroxylase